MWLLLLLYYYFSYHCYHHCYYYQYYYYYCYLIPKQLGSDNISFSFFNIWNLFCLRDHNENKAFSLFCVIPAKKIQFLFMIKNYYALYFIVCLLFLTLFNIFNITIIFVKWALYFFTNFGEIELTSLLTWCKYPFPFWHLF